LAIPRSGLVHELRRSYRFDYLPAGFFSRLMVHLLQVVDSPLYWKHGIVLLQANNSNKRDTPKPTNGGGELPLAATASPSIAARKTSPSFSLSASILSSSPHLRELRRSGLDFDVFQNGAGRRGKGSSGQTAKKGKGKNKVPRKEDEQSTGGASRKENSGKAGQDNSDKMKDEQRALLEEFPEKSMLKVHVYGANPGKLLRLIEVPHRTLHGILGLN
jgi:hypothetical protein